MDSTENKVESSNNISNAIKWWERKRLMYTLITLSGGLLVLLIRSGVPNGVGPISPIGELIFWIVVANIFYTCGWGFEVLFNYYFKFNFGNPIRLSLFIVGTVFSFISMFYMASGLL